MSVKCENYRKNILRRVSEKTANLYNKTIVRTSSLLMLQWDS